MLFNSAAFIFIFLPVTALVFFQSRKNGSYKLSIVWLVAASLFFYGYWNPPYLALILCSILFNYSLGLGLNRLPMFSKQSKYLLGFGIFVNLAAIGYFKYAGFLVSTLNSLLNTRLILDDIVLPLAISFFTFQQIAYLVDSYQRKTRHYSLFDYTLFVTFFPQLIAGPIVHHNEVIPQFSNRSASLFNANNIAVGITILAMGLFKKVVFADRVAGYATLVFSNAADDVALTFLEAWAGSIAYTLQLYFDFSGYSDMAIGTARIFGIKLPLNFNSPYKALDIADFWRRWHITLSNFLRDYLYIPLGGNRKGEFQRGVNLMVTMLLGGLWHGAGWVFIFWGGLHGLYLVIHRQWHQLCKLLGHNLQRTSRLNRLTGQFITFVAVVIGWVFFRAESMPTALSVLSGMAGFNGVSLAPELSESLPFAAAGWNVQFDGFFPNMNVLPRNVFASITALLLIVWIAPNTQEWIAEAEVSRSDKLEAVVPKQLPLVDRIWERLRWRPSQVWAVIGSISTMLALLHLTRVSEFLYFEF